MTNKTSLSARGANAALVLSDGAVYWGRGFGAAGVRMGEVCFNTSTSGYQEILTDPSYAQQIVNFTFPHIGNVGANLADCEAQAAAAVGLVVKAEPTAPSNYRAETSMAAWAESQGLVGIWGIDTRALTRRIRTQGPPHAALAYSPHEDLDVPALLAMARGFRGLEGADLAKEVTGRNAPEWAETMWSFADGYGTLAPLGARHHVVVVDFGSKWNILRGLASHGCRVTVVPATTPAAEILALAPDGVLLSNGPGDPAATGEYAVPMVRELLEEDLPVFGICLGHQILALALGAQTEKMHQGHRGANHPVKDLATGRVEITSQNHGFLVRENSLPPGVRVTHRSLFDGSIEGIALDGRPVFSVQYHPEASPGPRDSWGLFETFVSTMENS